MMTEDMLYYVCSKYQHDWNIGVIIGAVIAGFCIGVIFMLWRINK